MAGTKDKVVTVEALKTLHDYNKETYVDKDDVISVANGGTGSSTGATGLKNLFANGATILSSYQYGDELPTATADTVGRIFFKKLVE